MTPSSSVKLPNGESSLICCSDDSSASLIDGSLINRLVSSSGLFCIQGDPRIGALRSNCNESSLRYCSLSFSPDESVMPNEDLTAYVSADESCSEKTE
jgi:hypothetical protein